MMSLEVCSNKSADWMPFIR